MKGTQRELPDTIGGRIQRLRVMSGLTQGELAKKMGVKRETVNQWESETRDLKTGYMIKLAIILKTTCDYILRGLEPENVDVHEKIGLSDDVIEKLSALNGDNSAWGKMKMAVLNELLRTDDFENLEKALALRGLLNLKKYFSMMKPIMTRNLLSGFFKNSMKILRLKA